MEGQGQSWAYHDQVAAYYQMQMRQMQTAHIASTQENEAITRQMADQLTATKADLYLMSENYQRKQTQFAETARENDTLKRERRRQDEKLDAMDNEITNLKKANEELRTTNEQLMEEIIRFRENPLMFTLPTLSSNNATAAAMAPTEQVGGGNQEPMVAGAWGTSPSLSRSFSLEYLTGPIYPPTIISASAFSNLILRRPVAVPTPPPNTTAATSSARTSPAQAAGGEASAQAKAKGSNSAAERPPTPASLRGLPGMEQLEALSLRMDPKPQRNNFSLSDSTMMSPWGLKGRVETAPAKGQSKQPQGQKPKNKLTLPPQDLLLSALNQGNHASAFSPAAATSNGTAAAGGPLPGCSTDANYMPPPGTSKGGNRKRVNQTEADKTECQYYCKACGVGFQFMGYLRKHMRVCHNQPEYLKKQKWGCEICGKAFDAVTKLCKHFKDAHNLDRSESDLSPQPGQDPPMPFLPPGNFMQ